MNDINSIKQKYEVHVLKNLDRENFYKIVQFLLKENCDYMEDIVSDYLDLFNLQYEDFVNKYNILNIKYNGKLLQMASEDMNIFEEFFE